MNEFISDRMQKLLRELAKGFEEGTDLLLSTEWLSENGVTIDEVFALSNSVSASIEVYLALNPAPRVEALARTVLSKTREEGKKG